MRSTVVRAAPHVLVCRIIGLLLCLALLVAGSLLSSAGGMTAHARAANVTSASSVGGCPLFPANNIWNRDISSLPVHANSANFVASIGIGGHVHADFGAGLYNGEPIGIPYMIVPGSQPSVPVSFNYAGESDPGPYPVPQNAPIEGGAQSNGDRHVLVVNSGTCKLYEMFSAYPQGNGGWKAGSGAVWNLNSNALRPKTWTSADAAGLPILPGLARYDEVAAGAINHALRFTVSRSQQNFLWPARHQAGSSMDPNLPPMGLRLRLKASVNIAAFSPQNRVILTALQHYGMIVADNGSSWFIGGAPDNRWNNDDLARLSAIHGSDFEVVDESSLQASPDSGQTLGSAAVSATPTATPTIRATPTSTAIGLSFTQQGVVPTESTVAGKKNVGVYANNGGWLGMSLILSLALIGIALALVGVAWRRVMPRSRKE